MSGRVGIVVGPHPGLGARWEEVTHRWAVAVGLDATISGTPNASALHNALEEALRTVDAILLAPGELTIEPETAEALRSSDRPAVRMVHEVEDGTDPTGLRRIHGRGFAGFHWALRHLAAELAHEPRTIAYGDRPEQVADLRLPEGDGPHPVAALLHGGFWRHEWERDTLDQLAVAITERGWATWNVGYRRVGPTGGGWPTTWQDVAAALDTLGELETPVRAALDLDRCVLVGHSVGGALACWMASGSSAISPLAVVPVAGLLDLRHAAQVELGDGAVTDALGEPMGDPGRYEALSPVELVPLGLPTYLLHGDEDEVVPPVMSRTYQSTATAAGDVVRLQTVPGARHFDPLMPERPAGRSLLGLMDRVGEGDGGGSG